MYDESNSDCWWECKEVPETFQKTPILSQAKLRFMSLTFLFFFSGSFFIFLTCSDRELQWIFISNAIFIWYKLGTNCSGNFDQLLEKKPLNFLHTYVIISTNYSFQVLSHEQTIPHQQL